MKKFAFLIVLFLSIFAFSQKAYHPIYYGGKVENMTIKFTLTNGYINACELKTIDTKTKKTLKYLPENGFLEGANRLKLYHSSSSKKVFSNYFIIEQVKENYENIPQEFSATYFAKGKQYKFKLKKL